MGGWSCLTVPKWAWFLGLPSHCIRGRFTRNLLFQHLRHASSNTLASWGYLWYLPRMDVLIDHFSSLLLNWHKGWCNTKSMMLVCILASLAKMSHCWRLLLVSIDLLHQCAIINVLTFLILLYFFSSFIISMEGPFRNLWVALLM